MTPPAGREPVALIDLAHEPEFALGQLRVVPAERFVEFSGQRRELQPRVMQVFVALARAKPRVISRHQLAEMCWGGRVVSDGALNRCIGALRNLAKDLPPEPFAIETVPRVGHRLLEMTASLPSRRRPSRRLALTLTGSLVLAGGLGAAVNGGFVRSLGRAAASGEAYRDYQSARGMLRTFNPELGMTAVGLLRRAVAADPNYAPAWSALAEAIRLQATLEGHERVIATLPEAQADARLAVALAPKMPEGHVQLGVLLGFDSDEAQSHLRKAAALDPTSAEAQVWLAAAERVSGDFGREIDAYRRSAALDPSWYRPKRDLAFALAEMGDRAGAETVARQVALSDGVIAEGIMARIAWLYGDYAEAARRWWAVANGADSIWQAPARMALSNARFTLALTGAEPPRSPPPVAELRSNVGRIWMAAAPTAAVWRRRNRSVLAALVYHEQNFVGAKLMLARCRGRELVEGYDSPTGLLGLRFGDVLQPHNLRAAPLVALALRQAGRSSEAEGLLAQAQGLFEAVRRRGPLPFPFDADQAAAAAVAGHHDAALEGLRRAIARGWTHSAPDDLVRLQDEPAFAALRGDTVFHAIVASFDARLERERAAAIKLRL